ncbi:MAG TPA: Ig-like domain-containing protein [Cyclobacteriaceae bacterium]|jgi:uncharacterized protein (DUF2141 family)|nr:Ig-like domain-containing protein [Cyclobacteriaceae bacterium]
MKRLLLSLFSLILLQCARVSQPSGGPQDKEPPELESSIPASGEKNYKTKQIELTFNEPIKLKDPQEEIIITPPVGTKTKFLAKKNKVIITPEQDWKDSTTYSIAFRGAIQDLNEGNPTEDLHLAFSTGDYIDSLKISGTIAEIFQEKIPEKITVAVYQSDTFDIFKHKAIFFGKSNKEGKFSIQNLKPGRYFAYAFEDKNKNSRVDSKSEKFGFVGKPIDLRTGKDSIHINLIKVDSRPIKVTSVRNTNSISTIRFNKSLSKIKLTSDETKFIYSYGDNQGEVLIYKDFDKSDSVQINVSAYDSVQQELDTAVYIKYTQNKKIQENFKLTDWQIDYDPETKILQAKSTFNKLLLSANYDSIYIQIDSSNFQPIKSEELKFDTLNKIVTIQTKLKLEQKDNILNPVLLFGKSAFVSIDNDSTKAKEVKINLPTLKDTGTLSIQISTKEKHFELRLLNSSGKVVKTIRDQTKYVFKYLKPAEYRIVVVIDSNNNAIWDTAVYHKLLEPEKVVLYKNAEKKYTFPIRANWEVGPLVISF